MIITVIDLQVSNLDSVCRAIRRIGLEVQVTGRPKDIDVAEVLLLPGVGAFGDGMASLRKSSLVEPIRRHAVDKCKPLIGICLGMQLLADESEEHGLHEGLGLIPGRVVRLHPQNKHYRVPNMGWCDVTSLQREGPFCPIRKLETFYFAHSYHLSCANPDHVAATIEYDGQSVTAAVQRDNLLGVQFHPEKSQDAGIGLLAEVFGHFAALTS